MEGKCVEKEKENKCKGKSLVDRWILKKVYDYMLYVADAWNAVSFLPFPFPSSLPIHASPPQPKSKKRHTPRYSSAHLLSLTPFSPPPPPPTSPFHPQYSPNLTSAYPL